MKRILFLTAVILSALMLVVSCDNKNNEPEAKTYSVFFDYDNGSSLGTTEVKEGEKVEKPDDPEKTGYTFKEWQLNGETYDFENTVTANILLKAVWTINKYKVTFDTGNSSSYETQEIEYGGKAIDPGKPSRVSYIFAGWVYDGDKEFSFDTEITRDYELTAKWNGVIPSWTRYDVTFNVDGDTTIVPVQSVRSREYAHKPAKNPVSNYKVFKFWSESEDGENEFNFETTQITSAKTLYAVWEDDIYHVGGRGPAGGYIFYDCDADNESGNADGLISSICGWRYLEAALGDLNGTYTFGSYFVNSNYTNIGTYTEIGKGKENTEALLSVLTGAGTAVMNCKCYSVTVDGKTYNDWFLPSKDELDKMYYVLQKEKISSFGDEDSYYYWSSSEQAEAFLAWTRSFFVSSNTDILPDGKLGSGNRDSSKCRVRPVRRF